MPLIRAGEKKFDCNAVLFDKDGTLIDFKVMWLEWSKFMLEEVSAAAGLKPHEKRALEKAMGVDLKSWYVDPCGPLAGGTMSGLRDSMTKVLKGAGLREEEAHRLVLDTANRSEYAMDWEALVSPVPGLHEVLERLKGKGFKLAVVTADFAGRARLSMSTLGLLEFFDTVVGADCVKNSKPAPDMALLACRELGVEPGRAVVVGDTPRDIAMARDAGAAGVGVLSGVSTIEQLKDADAVIPSVVDLKV